MGSAQARERLSVWARRGEALIKAPKIRKKQMLKTHFRFIFSPCNYSPDFAISLVFLFLFCVLASMERCVVAVAPQSGNAAIVAEELAKAMRPRSMKRGCDQTP